jgi:hypothetical protein
MEIVPELPGAGVERFFRDFIGNPLFCELRSPKNNSRHRTMAADPDGTGFPKAWPCENSTIWPSGSLTMHK